jgi:hypothetical protein
MKELLQVYMEEGRLVVQPFVTYKNDPESRQLAEAVGAAVRSVIGDASLLRMSGHDLVRLYLLDNGMLETEVDAVVRSRKRSRALGMAVAEAVVRVVAGDAAAAAMRHLNRSIRTDGHVPVAIEGKQRRRHYYATDPDADPKTVANITAIANRISSGEPVPQELINQLPAAIRVEMPVKIGMSDGREVNGIIFIEGGKVTFRESRNVADADERSQGLH